VNFRTLAAPLDLTAGHASEIGQQPGDVGRRARPGQARRRGPHVLDEPQHGQPAARSTYPALQPAPQSAVTAADHGGVDIVEMSEQRDRATVEAARALPPTRPMQLHVTRYHQPVPAE
jgi:hypothetical protein